jgi:hypothetical protein
VHAVDGAQMAPLGGSVPGVVSRHADGDRPTGDRGGHGGRALRLLGHTHTGEWRGHAASGRRFENVDEVYFFEFEDERIAEAWGIEDTLDRMRQLGLTD